MMRTTAGSAIATARTTGSATLPPGLPLAKAVVVEVCTVPIIKRHTNPHTSSKRDDQRARCESVPVYPDLYICSILPLVTSEKLCLYLHHIIYIRKYVPQLKWVIPPGRSWGPGFRAYHLRRQLKHLNKRKEKRDRRPRPRASESGGDGGVRARDAGDAHGRVGETR